MHLVNLAFRGRGAGIAGASVGEHAGRRVKQDMLELAGYVSLHADGVVVGLGAYEDEPAYE